MLRKPWEETGMVVLQAESELAAINMVYGGASCGKKVMTSSSSPGISLKQEGITLYRRSGITLLGSRRYAWRPWLRYDSTFTK